ncbi:MAG TPA: DoxX family protein [Gemmatimonadales bacterium]|jgi:putative oxidoreductase|nr:DoxX family protein [Gemmatimonadales bacterium]
MNRFTPYAAVVLRVAVGLVFLHHGLMKLHLGIPGVAGFLHNLGIPFATFAAGLVTVMETLGAALLILGVIPRIIALGFAIEMAVAITFALIPGHQSFELEGLLLAGSLSLMASGGGPLSLQGLMRRA